MKMRITNPDYLPSDCDRCRRNNGTECVLGECFRKPIAVAKATHDRCGYYAEVDNGR